MCGRARCSLSREAVTAAAGLPRNVPLERWQGQERYRPSFNVSPGAWLPVLVLGAGGRRELRCMKWGLVPSFTRLGPGERPDHYRTFNARCETLAEKPIFSRLLLHGRRCVVLLDGFYEWTEAAGGRKQPYHVSAAIPVPPQEQGEQQGQQGQQEQGKQLGRPDVKEEGGKAGAAPPATGSGYTCMYMAGLYDEYRDPRTGEVLPSVTIITTDSSPPLAWLHDRMPVLLTSQEEVAEWLGEGWEHHAHGDRAGGSDAAAGAGEGTKLPEEQGAEQEGERKGTPQPHEQERGQGGGVAGSVEGEAGSGCATSLRQAQEKEAPATTGGKHSPGGKEHTQQQQQDAVALVAKLCRPYGGPLLTWHPVTPDMNKKEYDKPDAAMDVRTKKGSIASFFKPAARKTAATAATAANAGGGAGGGAEAGKVEPEATGPSAQQGPQGAGGGGAAAAAVLNSDECPGAAGGEAPGGDAKHGMGGSGGGIKEVPGGVRASGRGGGAAGRQQHHTLTGQKRGPVGGGAGGQGKAGSSAGKKRAK